MELLPYDKFSKLHIRDFLPEEEISEDDTGVEQSPLGFNRCRHLFQSTKPWLAFFYAESPPVELAGIDFQLNEGFPVDVASRVLAACAPPLRIGIGVDEVEALTGPPEYSTGREVYSFRRYRLGERWPYRIGCGFRNRLGLWSFWIVRDDCYEDDDG